MDVSSRQPTPGLPVPTGHTCGPPTVLPQPLAPRAPLSWKSAAAAPRVSGAAPPCPPGIPAPRPRALPPGVAPQLSCAALQCPRGEVSAWSWREPRREDLLDAACSGMMGRPLPRRWEDRAGWRAPCIRRAPAVPADHPFRSAMDAVVAMVERHGLGAAQVSRPPPVVPSDARPFTVVPAGCKFRSAMDAVVDMLERHGQGAAQASRGPC
jgi:hypothetical protein